MFVEIRCSLCGQPSQVPENLLGKPVECPLCKRATVAEVPRTDLPIAKPLEATAEIYSLDDAVALPPVPASISSPTRRRRIPTWLLAGVSIFLTILLMLVIRAGFRFGNGEVPISAYAEFKPEGGNCSLMMPGTPKMEEIPKEGFGMLGGRRFTSRRWLEAVQLDFGWVDLDPEAVQKTTFEQIASAERDRQVRRLSATVTRESAMQLIAQGRKFEGTELQMELPGKIVLVERFYMDMKAKAPKLYILAVAGKKIKPDNSSVLYYFNSFTSQPE